VDDEAVNYGPPIRISIPKKRRENPETVQQREIMGYLTLCRLGTVRRVNTGMLRVGDVPQHPWGPDNRRMVRFGQVGHSDLVVELANDPRSIFIEVKPLGWKPPAAPKPDAARSTWKTYRHYLDQLNFIEAQRSRGNFGFFATCAGDVYAQLTFLGFQGLPVVRPVKGRKP